MRRDLGDFQTPPELVALVLEALGPIGRCWSRVLEPTCGRGHFIAGLLAGTSLPREIQAIEIQESHTRAARELMATNGATGVRVRITRADVFDIDLGRDLTWREQGPLLVIGNPPWVTNSELGALASTQRPPRHNLKGLRGLEARTGSSNFDLTEAMWIKLAFELVDQQPTIALLCKTSVARSVLQFLHRAGLPIASASIHRIDAARWFSAAVDACLFRVALGTERAPPPHLEGGLGGVDPAQPITARQTGGVDPAQLDTSLPAGSSDAPSEPIRPLQIPVYSTLSQSSPDTIMGFARGWLVADYEAHERWAFADGVCPLDWRQGLKHDAAAVMELARDPASGRWCNRGGETVDVEPEFIYPLLKGTDLARPAGGLPERAILVTQTRLSDETARLATQAPRLWHYLHSHADSFSKRRSSIYRGRPPFALFGIGPYSFAPYKVAISGLHKQPRFRPLGPIRGRPIMLDDTCYLLPCSTAEEASILTALCNDPITLGLIGSMSFRDSKRPITKKLLQRLDFAAILQRTDRGSLRSRATAVQSDELASRPTEALCDVVARLDQRFSGRES